MKYAVPLRCPNCGNAWTIDVVPDTLTEAVCSVCQYHISLAPDEVAPQISSRDDFESQLSALVTAAQTGGIDADEIVRLLRDELEFVAELTHGGHQFYVQLIDLGIQTGEVLSRPLRDRRDFLQARSMNG
jgi:hypothetical protein